MKKEVQREITNKCLPNNRIQLFLETKVLPKTRSAYNEKLWRLVKMALPDMVQMRLANGAGKSSSPSFARWSPRTDGRGKFRLPQPNRISNTTSSPPTQRKLLLKRRRETALQVWSVIVYLESSQTIFCLVKGFLRG